MSHEPNEKHEQEEEIDIIQNAMGDFGWWQIIVCFAVSLFKVSVGWHQLAILFLAPPQDFWCARPPEHNTSLDVWRNWSIPTKHGKGSCEMYNVTDQDLTDSLDSISVENLAIIPCNDWEFDSSLFTHTIVSDWNLVCGQEYLARLAQTIFMAGILAGNFIFGILADGYGRKPPLLWAVALQVVAGVGTAFCDNFILFLGLRFLDAFATGGGMVTSFVICMEIVGRKWRAFITVMYNIPFSLGHLTLPGVAYIFPNWRHYQIVISLPSLILLSYYWLVPESPRWLLTAGRVEEATKVLEVAARLNKLPESRLAEMLSHRANQLQNQSKPYAKANFFQLLQHPNLRIKTLSISFNWLVCGVCFFGLAQYMGQIAGNVYVNVAAGGTIAIPGAFFCMYSMERFGRKKTLMVSQLLGGLSCLFLAFVPVETAWVTVILSATGLVCMSVSFPTVYLYSGELFPTVVRNVGVGFASMCARLGSMLAPFISSLDTFGSFLPPLVFAVFPVIAGVLCVFLPETMNTTLPDTIAQGEASGSNIFQKKNKENGKTNTAFQDDNEKQNTFV